MSTLLGEHVDFLTGFARHESGTRFGCSRGTPRSSPFMSALSRSDSNHSLAYVPRRRDRRQALADLLAALARALSRQGDTAPMRGAFEQMLRRLVPVRSIQLRDVGSRWGNSRSESAPGSESIVLEVPGPEPALKGVLEATFDPACRLGEWDFQMLGIAAHVAALVLELERNRTLLARAGLLNVATRTKRERSEPLVGSTPPIIALRTKIE